MRLLVIAIGFFIIGSFIFLVRADFSLYSPEWDTLYFMWAKGKDCLFFGSILYLLDKDKQWLIRPILFYSLINLAWELLKPMTGWDINNPVMVTTIFTALLIGVIMYLIKDLKTYLEKDL